MEKENMQKLETYYPRISVVTVCYNAFDTIEKTILSVINQTYKNIEYLIVDGYSTDGTIDVIKKYTNSISCFISEPDNGIYDAMNKGIVKATGDWIIFMNAGDVFCDNKILCKISGSLDKDSSFVYGNTICNFSGIYIHRIPDPIEIMLKHLPFSHQSVFIRSEFHKSHLYNIFYDVAADYDMFYHAYLDGEKFKYVDQNISIYEAEDGVSSRNYRKLCLEYAHIHGVNNKHFTKFRILWMVLFHQMKHFFKSIMPQFFVKIYYHIRLE